MPEQRPVSRGVGPIRQAFDRVERKVGRPLEQLVTTSTFTDAMVRGFHVQLALGRLVERTTAAGWHLLNLPTRSDVASLTRQIASLENDVRMLEAGSGRADRRLRGVTTSDGAGEEP